VPAPGIHPQFLATRLAVILAACVVLAERRRQGARELAASEAKFRAIFDHAAVGVALHDADGAILEANPAYERITGYARAELLTMRASDLAPPAEAALPRGPVKAIELGGREHTSVEKHVRRRDGTIRRCALTVTRVDRFDSAGAEPGLVGMLQDVTEHRALEEELVYRAYHDALTGLANRARFHDRLAEALRAACSAEGAHPGAGAAVAVLLVDLDGFKLVNDVAGHAAGDALLREVGARLLDAARGCELVARLGGDEFGVLLAGVRADADALAVADRIVAAVGRPFTVHGVAAAVGVSVGVARGGTGEQPPAPAGAPPLAAVDALLRHADLALYEAKARGKRQAALFEPGMHAAAVARVALEAALRDGLARGEFRLVYQPVVDLATGELSGVEALVRWEHPEHGLVPPAEFIPLAEETGLIRPIGRWVLEEACRQGAAWTAGGAPGATTMSVAVNVSGRQLQQPAFVDEVRAALEDSGFPAARLVLELTESTVIHQPEVARQQLGLLKALGVRLAIDDFGTGYSALSYLRQFPIDLLKIDKSFVDEIAAGGQPAALAGAIVGLGDALNLRTVAEGVESAEQAAALERLGCALAQGYHFSRPVGADAITALLVGGVAAAV
jgi:diguanylate cyclase (GGDEF)-like protein/PAS domain S-box-containing protein